MILHLFYGLGFTQNVKIKGIKIPARRIDMENHGDVIGALKRGGLEGAFTFHRRI